MSPGYALSDFDDIELSKARERGKFGILLAGKRDSAVLDAMTLVPCQKFYYIWPFISRVYALGIFFSCKGCTLHARIPWSGKDDLRP